MNRTLVLVLILSALVAGCGSSGSNSPSGMPSPAQATASASPSPAAAHSAEQQLLAAVRAYSDAFLDGQAKEAWLMRSDRANASVSYIEFRAAVLAGHQIYGDAEMTSLKVVKLSGKHALVTYHYDLKDIDQVKQPWVFRGGAWKYDSD